MADQNGLSGVEQIEAERKRQIETKGFVAEHDEQWTEGELVEAATALLLGEEDLWPWFDDNEESTFKSEGNIEDLVRAGALIAAEIDRLQRLEG
jgi:hypothetical protein